MKSNIIKLTQGNPFDKEVLTEVEKCAAYNGLGTKETLRLSLLAEELLGMLPNLTGNYDASFWIETEGTAYTLRAALHVPVLSAEEMKKAISVSTSGKNATATGLVGRIRFLINRMTAPVADDVSPVFITSPERGFDGDDLDMYSYAWSLDSYRQDVAEKKEAWDELEKSVLGKLADNVIVGVKDSAIDITVKKKF